MFTGISWGNYLALFTLLSLLWYGYVLFRYYQPEIKKLVNRKQSPEDSSVDNVATNFFIEEKEEMTSAGSFNEWQDTTQQDIEDLMRRVKNTVDKAIENTFNKAEFSKYLSLILKEFFTLKDSPYRGAINEFIENACEAKGILFTQDEADQLW